MCERNVKADVIDHNTVEGGFAYDIYSYTIDENVKFINCSC